MFDDQVSRGMLVDCAQLPVTVTFDLPAELHVETVSLVSDWWMKRPKASTLKAKLHAEAVWHPVSFDEHSNGLATECGDGVNSFGGKQCCYPASSCGGGQISFHTIKVSVVTDALQLVRKNNF
jgi:hypothetical protein